MNVSLISAMFLNKILRSLMLESTLILLYKDLSLQTLLGLHIYLLSVNKLLKGILLNIVYITICTDVLS